MNENRILSMFTRLLELAKAAELEHAKEELALAGKERTRAEEAKYLALQIIRTNDAAVRAIIERDAVAAGEIDANEKSATAAVGVLAGLETLAWDRTPFRVLPWEIAKKGAKQGCFFCFKNHAIEGYCETQYRAIEVAEQLLEKVAGGWAEGFAVMQRIVAEEDAEPCWMALMAASKRESDENVVLECIKATGLDPGKEWCKYCRRHVGRTRHWSSPHVCPVRTISSVIAARLLQGPNATQPTKKRNVSAMMESFEEMCNKIAR